MKDYLSVKDFAEAAHLSTQRVYQLLAKDLKKFCKVFANKKYISTEAFSALGITPNLQVNSNDFASDFANEKTTLEILQDTISVLRNQLEVKDKQIEALTAALTAAQALHAGSLQEQLTLPKQEITTEQEKEHFSFWSRLFKRKKGG